MEQADDDRGRDLKLCLGTEATRITRESPSAVLFALQSYPFHPPRWNCFFRNFQDVVKKKEIRLENYWRHARWIAWDVLRRLPRPVSARRHHPQDANDGVKHRVICRARLAPRPLFRVRPLGSEPRQRLFFLKARAIWSVNGLTK